MNIYDELMKPFPEEKIHWRIGSTNVKAVRRETGDQYAKPTKGIPLAYIDARDVMDRLDDVVGPESWQDRYPFPGCCEIGIKIDGEWVWKSNGAGQTDIEGEKGQFSDAFKRAAVMWGIGRYLYGLPNEWVELNERGQPKVKPKLPAWATPSGWVRIPLKQRKEFKEQMLICVSNSDERGARQLWDEWTQEEHAQLWKQFNSIERDAIKKILELTKEEKAA